MTKVEPIILFNLVQPISTLKDAKYFFLTHSDRRFDMKDGSAERIAQRFKDRSLMEQVPTLNELTSINNFVPWKGSISLWQVNAENLIQIAFVHLEYDKPQHVECVGDKVLILGTHTLGVYRLRYASGNLSLTLEYEIQDPWLAGCHMLSSNSEIVGVTSSAAEAILFFSRENFASVSTYQLEKPSNLVPLLFDRESNLANHYIRNDYQYAHLNSVALDENGFGFTTLSGLVKYVGFDKSEIVISRESTGAHSFRLYESSTFSFTHSPYGRIFIGDLRSGKRKSVYVESNWTHDALRTDSQVLIADTDENTLIMLSNKPNMLLRKDLSSIGEAPQFFSNIFTIGTLLN